MCKCLAIVKIAATEDTFHSNQSLPRHSRRNPPSLLQVYHHHHHHHHHNHFHFITTFTTSIITTTMNTILSIIQIRVRVAEIYWRCYQPRALEGRLSQLWLASRLFSVFQSNNFSKLVFHWNPFQVLYWLIHIWRRKLKISMFSPFFSFGLRFIWKHLVALAVSVIISWWRKKSVGGRRLPIFRTRPSHLLCKCIPFHKMQINFHIFWKTFKYAFANLFPPPMNNIQIYFHLVSTACKHIPLPLDTQPTRKSTFF